MKKFLKFLVFLLLAPPLLYSLAVVAGAVIRVEPDLTSGHPEISIFLQKRGAHTDIVVPFQNEVKDWKEVFLPEHSRAAPSQVRYLSFGWGDLEFFRRTPQWEDLEFTTGFKALFVKTPAALHVEFLSELPATETFLLNLNPLQYQRLADYLEQTLEKDRQGNALPVKDLHYHQQDAFYHARGSLSLFKTCNTWVNTGLKEARLPACLWTPFPQGITYTYRDHRFPPEDP